MPISASNAIATNTGASTLVEGLIWFEGSSSGATGPLRRQRPKHVITLPGSQTMTGNSMPGFTQANGFIANLERFADFTRDTVSWDFPAYVDEAGTVSSAFSVKDEDGATDTATAVNTTVSAISGYTRLYIDASSTATNGVPIDTDFTGTSGTALTAHDPNTVNAWLQSWTDRLGTFELDGSDYLQAVTANGAGYTLSYIETYTSNVQVECTTKHTAGETWPNGPAVRVGSTSTNAIWAGIDANANEVQLYKVVNNTRTLIGSTAFTDTLNTDYTIKITDDGTNLEVFVDDVSYITASESDLSGNTAVGILGLGIAGGDSGNVIFKDFKVTLPGSGAGTSTSDEISDIDFASRILDRNIDTICVDVAQGTYSPTTSIPVAQGTNAVMRWGTSGAKATLDTKDLPVGTDLFKVGQSSVTSRRASIRGFEITNSEAVNSEVDLSDAAVLDLTDDEITVSSAFYAACATEDPVLYAPHTGSVPTGLTKNTVYYVIKTGTTNVIKLATSAANAGAGTAINITALSSGTRHFLVLKGGQDIFDWNGNHIDLALVDIDVASDCADYTFRGIEHTFGTSDRLACIRVFKNNPKMWRYCIGIFGGPTYAEVDCGGYDVSDERPRRYNCGTNTLTVMGSESRNLNYSGKNPCRVQACGKGVLWGVNFYGSRISLGGDAGNADELRIDQSHVNGVDVFDSGDLCLASPIVTDQGARLVSGNAPAGADNPGAVGIRRANSVDSNTATGGFDILNPIVSFTGQGLASSQYLLNIGGSNATNVASNVNIENALLTFNGNTSAADRAVIIEHSPASAILTNCTIPQQENTTGNASVAGSINGTNVNESAFDSNAATTGTTFADVLHDDYFQPTGGDSGNIPNGVFNDAFGFGVNPGDGGLVGSVQGLGDLTLEINAAGNTIDIVSKLSGLGNFWGTPLTGIGKTLTLTGSISGTITATIPDEDVGVVVSTDVTIADTATFTASLDKTVQQGETVTVLRADIGIIDEVFSEDWQSEGLPTGAAVTNSSTQGGSGGMRSMSRTRDALRVR